MKRQSKKRRAAAMVSKLYECEADLSEVAGEMGMSLSQLSDLLSDAEVMGRIDRLREMSQLRSELFASRYRHHAVATLLRLMQSEADTGAGAETIRKACADVLKLTGQMLGQGAGGYSVTEADRPLDMRKILAKVGRATVGGGGEGDREQGAGAE
jgi:hypothetical protein